MLALKASVSKFMALPTIVFDEIDSGISGEVANKVGMIMDEMAMGMQVITITHLPQIAAKGEYHYLAYKDFDGDKTYSYLKKLDGKSRIKEIAKMLSGESLSNAAIDNARELLQSH
jgi:DNA repair protein RecN (Recombination protein N)